MVTPHERFERAVARAMRTGRYVSPHAVYEACSQGNARDGGLAWALVCNRLLGTWTPWGPLW